MRNLRQKNKWMAMVAMFAGFVLPTGCERGSDGSATSASLDPGKADEAVAEESVPLPLDSLYFQGEVALTAKLYEMRAGSPNHPDKLRAGVVTGLEMLGDETVGIKTYNTGTYGTMIYDYELALDSGKLAKRIQGAPALDQEILEPPAQGGDRAKYVEALEHMKQIVDTVAAGRMLPEFGFNYPPVPELERTSRYLQLVLDAVQTSPATQN